MSTITVNTRITTNDIARDYLAQFGNENVKGDHVELSGACHRCGGRGRGPWRQDGGICYECGGANTKDLIRKVPVKVHAQKLKQRLKRQAKAEQKRETRELAALEGQRDWCEKNTEFGRVTFIEKDKLQREKREAEKAKAADCPEGRMAIEGEVVSVKWKDSDYGGSLKMTVKTDDGYLVWGSVPSVLCSIKTIIGEGEDSWVTYKDVGRGDRVRFTGTVTPSDTDKKFGFFKRPAKAELLARSLQTIIEITADN